jgi:hypothetical protein
MIPPDLTKERHLPRVLGFAGHRKVADPERLREIIDAEIAAHLRTFGKNAVCYSSAAAGADLVFLESAASLGCPFWVILPFPAGRFAKDFDSPTEWERALALMGQAAWCGVLDPAPDEAPAENAYQFAARRMLQLSGRMLFFWDGEPARGPGGTAETVEDARREKIPSRVIDAHTLTVRDLV